MNDCEFISSDIERSINGYGDPESDNYLFMWCNKKGLECVSIKNATWRDSDDTRRFRRGGSGVLPQEVLIKFVRKTPSLRWFRSDLTAANVAMLKEERPEITFVSA